MFCGFFELVDPVQGLSGSREAHECLVREVVPRATGRNLAGRFLVLRDSGAAGDSLNRSSPPLGRRDLSSRGAL